MFRDAKKQISPNELAWPILLEEFKRLARKIEVAIRQVKTLTNTEDMDQKSALR